MNIVNKTNAVVVGKNERRSTDNKSYYTLACLQNGQCFNISVDEEIFNNIPITDGTCVPVVLETVYNDQYKSFRATRLLDAPPSVKSGK